MQREIGMKKAQTIMLTAVAVSLTVTTSQGAIFSDFESPTYTAASDATGELGGKDNWVTAIGSLSRARVTPTYDADIAANITTVLDGSQSMYLKGTQAYRGWNGLESFVQDGLEISWLMQVDAATRAELYLSPDVAGLSTPIGLQFQNDGDIIAATPNSGFVDTGENYIVDKTYRFTMLVDFTNGTVDFTGQNVTDGGGVINLGTGNTGSISPVDYATGGGLYLVERDSKRAFFDTIEVVPEPGTAMLLAMGGLAVLWRRRCIKM